MTYCLAIHVEAGLVFCSDSRTNAGTDHVNTYSKMHEFVLPGQRFFSLLSSGNLATTQVVVQRLRQDLETPSAQSLWTVPSLAAAADYVGWLSADVQRVQAGRDTANTVFEASFILGGQIAGESPGIYLIYPQGNYIHESADHPFLQIGESKYGKPILDRVVQPSLSLEAAARCALVSMNSTIRSNLTVGPPIELGIYRADSLQRGECLSLHDDDPFYKAIADGWSAGLARALEELPRFPWEGGASS
ncbi:peptidase [Acidithiobacillus sp. CV18-2]|uniref:Peptidase n=1 Tax=Igneacidithiobacillus copahuensis TaxID=2724909 RepID=A0AAE3CKE6_9PROT|nr:peptidase [Igneacidithiobacillus copahuensis]MBU2753239.1 peptidase [Acidithiobacillus sp. CV18-3]MBU2757933.1 peptidase [Acidithiobacillus sp. BN09-2]MBU2777742.1 peptidase [Acidithiobacillus sp. CV18-2]MBU2796781.1 peptidase [Acidithiobacillus sp. VAN18-2]MBU2800467.1 peptidase [Acidithiobacillus sp. VAN18-4]UTV80266.1 peptidase [Acidithiobacillus sp. YTS05]